MLYSFIHLLPKKSSEFHDKSQRSECEETIETRLEEEKDPMGLILSHLI